MGLVDRLRGIHRPGEGTEPVAAAELRRRLLALNHEDVPFLVREGSTADLEAEWRIVDAAWYEVFAKAGLTKAAKLHLGLAESRHELRMLEEQWEVSWRAGVPDLRLSAERFRGRTFASKEFGVAYAFTGVDPLEWGKAYQYRFDVAEMKRPVTEVALDSGWSLVPVATAGGLTD